MSGSKDEDRTYIGVGVAFFALAVAMWITMDSWAVALPFAVLAITFVILGVKRPQVPEPPRGSRPEEQGER
ncbi:hypothetical protein ACEXQD_04655 [Herbiconiux sp. P15]|uniref:hypothetical protein n=1 Tax=Herbiconiux liukaitaii TaxID=3342799 RepID=UPI0035B82784